MKWLFVVSATYRLSYYLYKYQQTQVFTAFAENMQRQLSRTFFDGSIHLHTDRLSDRFCSDYTLKAALNQLLKCHLSYLKECCASDNTF